MDVICADVPGGKPAVEPAGPGAGRAAAIMSQAGARAAAGLIAAAPR